MMSLGVPCVTIRENKERLITVKHGTEVIAGTSMPKNRKAIARWPLRKKQARIPAKWDGQAARQIVLT
jgi:UDP-N-acetylglucosamine 2-epimerase (non-hydrolysing)